MSPAAPPRIGYGGVAPLASFTRPEPPITTVPQNASASGRRPPWTWIALFLVAAMITTVGAGALAYVVRVYLAH
jgi:hypothetical protein